MKALTLLFVTVALSLVLVGKGVAGRRPDPTWPPEYVTPTVSAVAGEAFTFTITMENSCPTDEELFLSATPGVFSDLPSSVIVPAGCTSVEVTATVDSGASGYVTIVAANPLDWVASDPEPIEPSPSR